MTTPDPVDSTRRAVREALVALDRGDAVGANAIARAHAAQERVRNRRVSLILRIRECRALVVDEWDDTEAS